MAKQNRALVTRQVLSEHFSAKAIRCMIGRGDLVAVRRGVYRLPGLAMDYELQLLATVMASGPDAFASGRSAVWLWGLRLPTLEGFEITRRAGRRSRVDDVICHQSTEPSIWITSKNGIPVTSVERTLLEASCFSSAYYLEKAMEDAIIRKLTTIERLNRCYKELTRQGRRKFAFWREILERRNDLSRVLDSHIAARVGNVLNMAGIFPPESEYWVRTKASNRYLDFAFPELRIGIECDGRAAHESVRFEDDRRRDREFAVIDWLILRFTASTAEFEIINDVTDAIKLRRSAVN